MLQPGVLGLWSLSIVWYFEENTLQVLDLFLNSENMFWSNLQS